MISKGPMPLHAPVATGLGNIIISKLHSNVSDLVMFHKFAPKLNARADRPARDAPRILQIPISQP